MHLDLLVERDDTGDGALKPDGFKAPGWIDPAVAVDTKGPQGVF
jgi:hypothetical protein